MEHTCCDDQLTIDSLIDLTIRLLSCFPAGSDGALTTPKNLAEPMQLGRVWPNKSESEQCR